MQSRNQFFDDLAKITTEGLSFAQGLNQEVQNFCLGQAEKAGQALGFVSQEQFDSLALMCQKQAEALQSLTELCTLLQARLDRIEGVNPPFNASVNSTKENYSTANNGAAQSKNDSDAIDENEQFAEEVAS
jgi:BMFP domain-containing protein YqiC